MNPRRRLMFKRKIREARDTTPSETVTPVEKKPEPTVTPEAVTLEETPAPKALKEAPAPKAPKAPPAPKIKKASAKKAPKKTTQKK